MSLFDIFKKAEPSKTARRKIGDEGEQIACEYLSSLGYAIVDRNVNVSHKELDIIAEDDEAIVFVEVKSLSCKKEDADSGKVHRASDQISRDKINNLLYAAERWHAAHFTAKQPRIDVVEVYLGDSPASVVHLINAVNKKTTYRKRR